MTHYIDADELRKEVEQLKASAAVYPFEEYGTAGTCIILLSIIDSLQQEQPEVDLEKEIQEYIKECVDVKFPTTDIELIKKDVAHTARKFYELGLNARKEK